MTGNVTLTFTAPSGPCVLWMEFIQDGTGSRTVAYPSSVKVTGGVFAGPSAGANEISLFRFYFNGTNYYLNEAMTDMS